MAIPIDWQRADPAELEKFDPRTKTCMENCGPHREDPRSSKERRFLCDECHIETSDLEVKHSEQSQ